MRTSPKTVRIGLLMLALAMGFLVRQSQKLAVMEDQPSVVNIMRAVAHLKLRRSLKTHSNVTASHTRKANPHVPPVTKSQEST
jgi:hypothetical protein